VHRRLRRNESMSQARRRLGSDVELPVPAQGSPLDFLFAQERSSAVATESGRLRSCSAKSRSPTTTSPVIGKLPAKRGF
jgi:hypothetical protein